MPKNINKRSTYCDCQIQRNYITTISTIRIFAKCRLYSVNRSLIDWSLIDEMTANVSRWRGTGWLIDDDVTTGARRRSHCRRHWRSRSRTPRQSPLYHQHQQHSESQEHRQFEAQQVHLARNWNNVKQEVKVIWQKAPHGGPIPRLGVTPGGRNLYHWIPGVGVPISVP